MTNLLNLSRPKCHAPLPTPWLRNPTLPRKSTDFSRWLTASPPFSRWTLPSSPVMQRTTHTIIDPTFPVALSALPKAHPAKDTPRNGASNLVVEWLARQLRSPRQHAKLREEGTRTQKLPHRLGTMPSKIESPSRDWMAKHILLTLHTCKKYRLKQNPPTSPESLNPPTQAQLTISNMEDSWQ